MSSEYFLIDESFSEENPFFIPKIFDHYHSEEKVPAEFNSVKIVIDGRADGSLDWKEARRSALNAIGKGLKIFWMIDLGLPDRLYSSLSDQTQFLALGLSLDHFRNTLWNELHAHSIGLCMYCGSADFSLHFPWDSEQEVSWECWWKERMNNQKFDASKPLHQYMKKLFCRDALSEYLELLAERLPDAIPLYVMLDATSIKERTLLVELINKDILHRFQRFVTDSIVPAGYLTGRKLGFLSREPVVLENTETKLGVCMTSGNHQPVWESALEHIADMQISYRIISESVLTAEWDGLDHMLVMPDSISAQGIRKLRGFCAAGGTVISLSEPIGLPHEISFSSWKQLTR